MSMAALQTAMSQGVTSIVESQHHGCSLYDSDDLDSPVAEAGSSGNSGIEAFLHCSVPAGVMPDALVTLTLQPTAELDGILSLGTVNLEDQPPSAPTAPTLPNPQVPTRSDVTGKQGKAAEGKKKQVHRCEQCSATFRRASNLKTHLQRHLGHTPFACPHCPAAFVEEKNLKRHLVSHCTERPHVCGECGLAFVENGNLVRHMSTHAGAKDFVCHTCGAAFSKAHHLKSHLQTHVPEGRQDRACTCDECSLTFNNPFQLRKHIRAQHSVGSKGVAGEGSGNGRGYMCGQCGLGFGWWTLYQRHLLTHQGHQPFACTLCPQTFDDHLRLRAHKRTHAREKKRRCEVCGLAFDRPSHLNRHLRVHTGERPNVCSQCGAAFLERSKLVRHMAVHTAEGNGGVVCELCGARFTRTRHLTHHMRIHHQSAPHSEERDSSPAQGKDKERSPRQNGVSTGKYRRKPVQKTKLKDVTMPVHSSKRARSGDTKEQRSSSVQGSMHCVNKGPTKQGNTDLRRGKQHITRQWNQEFLESIASCLLSLSQHQEQNASDKHSSTEHPNTRQTRLSSNPSATLEKQPSRAEEQGTTGSKDKCCRKQTGGADPQHVIYQNRKLRGQGVKVLKTMPKNKARKVAHCREVGDSNGTGESDVCVASSCTGQKIFGSVSVERLDAKADPEAMDNDSVSNVSMGGDPDDSSVVTKCESTEELKAPASREESFCECGVGDSGAGSEVIDTKEAILDQGTSSRADAHQPGGIAWAHAVGFDSGQCIKEILPHDSSPISAAEGIHAGLQAHVHAVPIPDSSAVQDVKGIQEVHGLQTVREMQKVQEMQILQGLQTVQEMQTVHGLQTVQEMQKFQVKQELQEMQGLQTAQRAQTVEIKREKTVQEGQIKRERTQGDEPRREIAEGGDKGVREAPGGGQGSGFVLFACQQCTAVFNSAFSLKLHRRVHQSRTAVCLRCGDIFPQSSALALHRQACTNFLPPLGASSSTHTSSLHPYMRRPHGCGQCGATFDDVGKLKLHMRLHSDALGKHLCGECGASFLKSTDLKAHARTHTGDRPFVCGQCGASYTQSSSLSVHMRTHMGLKPFVCKDCGATFPRHGRLKAHMRCHSGEKPCVCKVCGEAFRWSQTLQRHMNTHHHDITTTTSSTSSCPHLTCKVCSTSFVGEHQLKVHLEEHNGERPHACPHCSKAFRTAVQLRRHSHVHTGARPFLCEKCGAGFGSAAGLKVHTRCHTGEKPFVCELCGRAFRISSHLNRHVASHTEIPVFVRQPPL